MTREEAIKILVNATFSDEWQGNEDLTTAYNMAIEALSEPTKTEPTTITENMTNGDVIKAMFSKDYVKIYDRSVSSWWNAPYKGNFTMPTRPKAKWIGKEITEDYRVRGLCSNCRQRRLIDHYCPNCGAEMKHIEDKKGE